MTFDPSTPDPARELEYAPPGRAALPIDAGRPVALVVTIETLRFAAWLVLTLIAVGLVVGFLSAAVSPILGVLGGVAMFVILPAISGMRVEVRRRRGTVILSYLAQAATLNLPLARMLDAAQRSEPRKIAKPLRRLRDLLEDGAPLELALPAAAPDVPSRAVGLIAAAERVGRLPQVLRRIVAADTDAGTAPGRSRDTFARWYPVLMTLALLTLVSLILVFVIPKFEQIFRDFGLKLPYTTQLLIGAARTVFGNGVVLLALPLLLLLALVSAFRGAFGGGDRSGRRLGWVDALLWRLPVVHAMQRDEGLADACATIADALRTGLPLPRAIDEAARLRINRVLRDRLVRWRGGLEGGMGADEAAHRAELPALLSGMVASGRGGEPAEAMEFLAAYYGGRFSRARELIRAASVPVLVLVFGGMILFLAAGMYTPILNLMDYLSANAMKVSR